MSGLDTEQLTISTGDDHNDVEPEKLQDYTNNIKHSEEVEEKEETEKQNQILQKQLIQQQILKTFKFKQYTSTEQQEQNKTDEQPDDANFQTIQFQFIDADQAYDRCIAFSNIFTIQAQDFQHYSYQSVFTKIFKRFLFGNKQISLSKKWSIQQQAIYMINLFQDACQCQLEVVLQYYQKKFKIDNDQIIVFIQMLEELVTKKISNFDQSFWIRLGNYTQLNLTPFLKQLDLYKLVCGEKLDFE